MDETTTSINSPRQVDEKQTADIYDLMGRKVVRNAEWNSVKQHLPKGVYIVNGRKWRFCK